MPDAHLPIFHVLPMMQTLVPWTKTLLESDGGVVGHNLVQRTTVEPSRIHELGHPNLRTAAQAARGSYLGALVRKGCRRVSSVFVRRERATATSVGAASS